MAYPQLSGFRATWNWTRDGYFQNPPEPFDVTLHVNVGGFEYSRTVSLTSDVTTREAAQLLGMTPVGMYRLARRNPARFALRKRKGVWVVRVKQVLAYGVEKGKPMVKHPAGGRTARASAKHLARKGRRTDADEAGA